MNASNSRVTLVSIGVAVLALLAVVCGTLFGDQIRTAFKTTDPSSTSFNPMAFRFDDYAEEDVYAVVVEMFPLGTERDYVRQIMAASNATTKQTSVANRQDADFYAYTRTVYPGRTTALLFVFDANQKLRRIASDASERRVLIGN